jgi:hypothetical protein
MATPQLMFIPTIHKRTTRAIKGLTRRTAIGMATLRPMISLLLPEAEVLHLRKHLHITLCPTQILGNVRIARVLGMLSHRSYTHSRHTSTDTDHNAFVHIAVLYPAITAPRNTCMVVKTCTTGETGTHTTSPRPIRLTILLMALPTGSPLSYPIVPTPPAGGLRGGPSAKGINPSLTTTLKSSAR